MKIMTFKWTIAGRHMAFQCAVLSYRRIDGISMYYISCWKTRNFHVLSCMKINGFSVDYTVRRIEDRWYFCGLSCRNTHVISMYYPVGR